MPMLCLQRSYLFLFHFNIHKRFFFNNINFLLKFKKFLCFCFINLLNFVNFLTKVPHFIIFFNQSFLKLDDFFKYLFIFRIKIITTISFVLIRAPISKFTFSIVSKIRAYFGMSWITLGCFTGRYSAYLIYVTLSSGCPEDFVIMFTLFFHMEVDAGD